MAIFNAKIFEGDSVLLENIEVDLEVYVEPSGLSSWDGWFTLPGLKFSELQGNYRLVLEDGRSGDMWIKKVAYHNSEETAVHFQGTGPLQ